MSALTHDRPNPTTGQRTRDATMGQRPDGCAQWGKARSASQDGVHEGLGLERRQVVRPFTQPDQLDRHPQLALDRDVKIGGGVETVRQYLRAGVIDELHFALSPVVLGEGEAIFAGVDLPALGYRVTEHQATEHAMHIVLSR